MTRDEKVLEARRLRNDEGLAAREIAEVLGASESTIRNWYLGGTCDIAEQVGESEAVVRGWIEWARRLDGRPISMRRLSQKDKMQRYALIARRIREGRSNAEIAAELGTSIASVNQMASHARRQGFDMPYRSEVAA